MLVEELESDISGRSGHLGRSIPGEPVYSQTGRAMQMDEELIKATATKMIYSSVTELQSLGKQTERCIARISSAQSSLIIFG